MEARSKILPPSSAQRRLLFAAAMHKLGRIVGGDPRTRAKLLQLGWSEVDGYDYGPLFRITDAGRSALSL